MTTQAYIAIDIAFIAGLAFIIFWLAGRSPENWDEVPKRWRE